MTRRHHARYPAWRTLAIPFALALLSLAGLLAGLLDDGIWDVAGTLALGLPLLVAVAAACRIGRRPAG